MTRILTSTALGLILTLGAASTAAAQSESAFAQVQEKPSDVLANDFMGKDIYASKAGVDDSSELQKGAQSEWDKIGDVKDIIISSDGAVKGVVVSVGGFLGIGDHDIAINMDKIIAKHAAGKNGEVYYVVNATREQIKNAPEIVQVKGSAVGADQQNQAAQQQDASQKKIQQAGEQAAQQLRQAGQQAAQQVREAGQDAAKEVRQTGDEVTKQVQQAGKDAMQQMQQSKQKNAQQSGDQSGQQANGGSNAQQDADQAKKSAQDAKQSSQDAKQAAKKAGKAAKQPGQGEEEQSGQSQ